MMMSAFFVMLMSAFWGDVACLDIPEGMLFRRSQSVDQAAGILPSLVLSNLDKKAAI